MNQSIVLSSETAEAIAEKMRELLADKRFVVTCINIGARADNSVDILQGSKEEAITWVADGAGVVLKVAGKDCTYYFFERSEKELGQTATFYLDRRRAVIVHSSDEGQLNVTTFTPIA